MVPLDSGDCSGFQSAHGQGFFGPSRPGLPRGQLFLLPGKMPGGRCSCMHSPISQARVCSPILISIERRNSFLHARLCLEAAKDRGEPFLLLSSASDAPKFRCTERDIGARPCAESASRKMVGRELGRGRSPDPILHQSAGHMKTQSHVLWRGRFGRLLALNRNAAACPVALVSVLHRTQGGDLTNVTPSHIPP